jgi:hypothetical protein
MSLILKARLNRKAAVATRARKVATVMTFTSRRLPANINAAPLRAIA